MSEPTTATEQTPAALTTEAAELTQDIKETKTEAAAERAAGNDERADKLEASIAKTQADLDEIKGMLKGLTDRPFHPAPGDEQQPPPATPADDGQQAQQQTEEPPADKPKGKRHWLYGDRWNQE